VGVFIIVMSLMVYGLLLFVVWLGVFVVGLVFGVVFGMV